MKWLAASLVLLAADAFAFDSEAWFEKRAVLDREAERLEGVFADCRKRAKTPADDVTLPLETYPDGSIKSTVTAAKSQFFLDTGFVWGTGVVVRQFATNGVVESSVRADSAVIDRETRSAWIDGYAEADYLGKCRISGDGVYISLAEEYVRISSNASITVNGRAMKSSRSVAGGHLAGGAGMCARRADFDRTEGVLLFDGGVTVTNAEYRLSAERVFSFIDGTNSLRRLVADGGVSIATTNATRVGTCSRATYVASLGRIVMFGDGAERPARLCEDGHRRNEVLGRTITFWLDSEQVEVEGASITVDGGILGGRGDAFGGFGK